MVSEKTVMSQCILSYSVVSTIPKHLPCSLKICYAVHEIIYTEQHTKLFVLLFFVCNVGCISRLWERRSPGSVHPYGKSELNWYIKGIQYTIWPYC